MGLNKDKRKYISEMPIGSLCLMPLKGTEKLTQSINDYILNWRSQLVNNDVYDVISDNYIKDSYIVYPELNRFGSGEGKGVINDTVRGADIFIIVDVCNYSVTYKLFGECNHYSPDDHFQDLKRVIAAINGKAKRISVIMPFLYESRQHNRTKRESLDCAIMLQELQRMNIANIITVDAHDPRVMNSIPLSSFDSVNCSYQFIKSILDTFDDMVIDAEHLVMISPDTGAMNKSIFFANVLGVDIGFFYKRRDYTKVVDGKNPIVAHEYLGNDLKGKDAIIIDDMISSGDSLVDTAKELKNRGAKRVITCCTFGLFTQGLEIFDKAYEDKIIDKIFTTNCIYQRPGLFEKKWYKSVDVTEYLARIIESINHDSSISTILDPSTKIRNFVKYYKKQH